MENKKETLGPFKGIYRFIQGIYWGCNWDNGNVNENYYIIIGFRVRV